MPISRAIATSPTVPGKAPYLNLLEAYRGIASTAVVLHHIGAIALKQHHVDFTGGFFSACHLRLDFFFVLSGFIIAWLHAQDIGRPAMAKPFLLKRFWRLYPLLFLLTTAKLAAVLTMGGWRWDKYHLDTTVILSSYLMLPMERFPLLLAAWTMPYEVLFYLIFAVAIITSRKTLAVITVLWVALIAGAHLLLEEELAFPLSFFLKPFHLQLLAGVAAGILVRRYGNVAWGGVVMGWGFGLLAVGLLTHQWIETLPMFHARCWWALVFCILIAGSAMYEARRSKPAHVPRWLKALGRASYSTYLIHGPLLVFLLAWCAQKHLLEGYWKDLTLATCGLAAILAGILCHRLIERPITHWTRRISHVKRAGQTA
ncbi:MAG: acyltransferase [Prosthecobacter sp.]|nr:acyltransferase [Prosthecobacter sp.]